MMQVANAPCSWGVIENVMGKRGGYATCIDEMQETGYVGTELGDWGFMPTDPEELREELAERGLKLVASWVSVRLYDPGHHAAGVAAAIRTAELLAEVGGPNSLIVLGDDHSTDPVRSQNAGRIRPEHGLTAAGWRNYTEGATQVAAAVKRESGLRTVIHHHGATYVETPAEVDTFLRLTDPALIGLCFDTGHFALGGGDPVSGLRRYGERVWHVHFKDFDPAVVQQAAAHGWTYNDMVGHGVFSELGQGVVDFPAVLVTLRELDYHGWIVVEQDVLPGMGRPKESAARNRAYLQTIGL